MNKQINSEYSIDHFTRKIIATLDKKILTLSDGQIDDIFRKIQRFAADRIEELVIVSRLLDHCDQKRFYFFSRKERQYDYDYFKYALRWFIVMIVSGFFVYCIIVHYDGDYRENLNLLIKKLQQYGITVEQCHKGAAKTSQYYLQVVSVNKTLNENDYFVARHLLAQARHIHYALYGWIRWSIIIAGVLTCMAIWSCFHHLRNWLRPYNNKKRYEQWYKLVQKFRQKKEEILATMESGHNE